MFKKTRKSKSPIILIWIFVIFLSAVTFYLSYNNFLFKKPLYISPIAKNSESSQVKIENTLREKDIFFTQITSSESAFLVFLKDGGEVFLPLTSDIEQRINSLQLILKQFTIEGKKFKIIDFRFDKPTILF